MTQGHFQPGVEQASNDDGTRQRKEGSQAGPLPGFICSGAENTRGRAHFLDTILDVCSNRGANMK